MRTGKALLTHHVPHEAPVNYRLNVMAYELGDLTKGAIYAQRIGERLRVGSRTARNETVIKAIEGHRALMKAQLGDLVTQCRLLAEEMGWEWDELVEDGEERFIERMAEIRKGRL